MLSKADRELAYARYLQSQLDELAGYTLVSCKPPEPDIAGTRGASVIGIEITEIHGNPPLRMTEAEQERSLRRAEQIWLQRALPPIGVVVYWRPTRMPQKYARAFPGLLVDLVSSRLPPAGEIVQIDDAEAAARLGSQSAVEHIFARLSVTGITEWGSGRRWQASQPEPSFYQQEIDRKNSKPAGYLTGYDARWLVLVHHGGSPSSGFDIAPHIERALFTSTFDQGLLLSLTPLKVRRLRLRHP